MKKCLVSTVLCFLVFLGIFIPYTKANTNQEFNDLSSNQRFYKEIHYLVNKGIITGFPYKTFRSDQAVTREQAAIMIGRALHLDGSKRTTKFNGYGYVNKANVNRSETWTTNNVNPGLANSNKTSITKVDTDVFDRPKGSSIGTIKAGYRYPVIAELDSNWWKVDFGGRIGYIAKNKTTMPNSFIAAISLANR